MNPLELPFLGHLSWGEHDTTTTDSCCFDAHLFVAPLPQDHHGRRGRVPEAKRRHPQAAGVRATAHRVPESQRRGEVQDSRLAVAAVVVLSSHPAAHSVIGAPSAASVRRSRGCRQQRIALFHESSCLGVFFTTAVAEETLSWLDTMRCYATGGAGAAVPAAVQPSGGRGAHVGGDQAARVSHPAVSHVASPPQYDTR